MGKIKVVHYINQFFAQIGGEEKADIPPQIRKGEVVGPGLALMQSFGEEAEITATIICGDSYFNENIDAVTAQILEWVKEEAPDVFVAGPAFNAGRYGVACGTIADAVQSKLGIPAVTGMYVENPGADMFKDKVLIVSTKNSAAGMKKAVKTLAPLVLKVAKGEKIGASCEEGYIPQNKRVNFFEKERGSLIRQNIRCRISTVWIRTRRSKISPKLRSRLSHQAVSYRKEILITSKVPVHLISENMTLKVLWILLLIRMRLLTEDMIRHMPTRMLTVYFRSMF